MLIQQRPRAWTLNARSSGKDLEYAIQHRIKLTNVVDNQEIPLWVISDVQDPYWALIVVEGCRNIKAMVMQSDNSHSS